MTVRQLTILPFTLPHGGDAEVEVTITFVDENGKRIQGIIVATGEPVIDRVTRKVYRDNVLLDIYPQEDIEPVLNYELGADLDSSKSYYSVLIEHKPTRYRHTFRTQVAQGGALSWAEFATGQGPITGGELSEWRQHIADTGLHVPAAGLTNQVLAKLSDTDGDTIWIDNVAPIPVVKTFFVGTGDDFETLDDALAWLQTRSGSMVKLTDETESCIFILRDGTHIITGNYVAFDSSIDVTFKSENPRGATISLGVPSSGDYNFILSGGGTFRFTEIIFQATGSGYNLFSLNRGWVYLRWCNATGFRQMFVSEESGSHLYVLGGTYTASSSSNNIMFEIGHNGSAVFASYAPALMIDGNNSAVVLIQAARSSVVAVNAYWAELTLRNSTSTALNAFIGGVIVPAGLYPFNIENCDIGFYTSYGGKVLTATWNVQPTFTNVNTPYGTAPNWYGDRTGCFISLPSSFGFPDSAQFENQTLSNYGQTVQALGNVSGALSVDISQGQTVTAALIANGTSFTITNPSGHVATLFSMLLDTGGFDVTSWAPSVAGWFGAVPDLSSGGVHGFTFELIGGDWYGMHKGQVV